MSEGLRGLKLSRAKFGLWGLWCLRIQCRPEEGIPRFFDVGLPQCICLSARI